MAISAEEHRRLAEMFWLRLLRTGTKSTKLLTLTPFLLFLLLLLLGRCYHFPNNSDDVDYDDKGGGVHTRAAMMVMTATSGRWPHDNNPPSSSYLSPTTTISGNGMLSWIAGGRGDKNRNMETAEEAETRDRRQKQRGKGVTVGGGQYFVLPWW